MDDYDDEGNANELEFGREFDVKDEGTLFLSNDEVHVLLDQKRAKNEENGITASEYVYVGSQILNLIYVTELLQKPFSIRRKLQLYQILKHSKE